MPEIVDCHTHTHFSDGHGTFAENAQAALAAGCTTLVSTDHLTLPHEMDPECECSIPEADLAAHREALMKAREAFPNLEIVYGFEADWYEGCEEYIARWRGDATFLLGSVHFLDGMPLDYSADMTLYETWGVDGAWERYVDAWCTACSCSARFDSMAHPDIIKIFSKSGWAPSIALEPLWDRMAEAALEASVHVELSTAGLRKPCAEYYPSDGLLRRFCKAGIPLTVGSDGHAPGDICHGIKDACAHAYEIGYRSIDVPRAGGGWRTIEL